VISAESLRALYRPTATAAAADGESRIGPAIITCMDPRLHPERSLGINVGDAYVIRNAGGRASDDAVRSVVVACAISGVDRIVIIHHTDCGLLTFTDEGIKKRLRSRHGVDVQAGNIDFMTFSDLETSVRSDIARIRQSAFVPKTLTIVGFVCDTGSGRLKQVRTERPQANGTSSAARGSR
jgi:carbonic anhydrase